MSEGAKEKEVVVLEYERVESLTKEELGEIFNFDLRGNAHFTVDFNQDLIDDIYNLPVEFEINPEDLEEGNLQQTKMKLKEFLSLYVKK